MENSKPKFDKAAYNKAYLAEHKEKYNKMSRDRNYDRYYNDEEFRLKVREQAKLAQRQRRMALKVI